MPKTHAPAKNYYTRALDGYTVCRYLCENAPTDQVRPKARLEEHTYEVWSVGNGPGWSWMSHLRTKKCDKCGGAVIPINEWKPKEEAVEPA